MLLTSLNQIQRLPELLVAIHRIGLKREMVPRNNVLERKIIRARREFVLETIINKSEAVKMKVLGKHSRGGQREYAYGMYGAVSAFKAMKAARPDAKADDPLFTEQHREGIKELLKKAGLRENEEGRTRDSKSLRQTGISLRLELSPNPDYRHIAKWARTSPAMIAAFYDQTHPQTSVEAILGFKGQDD